MLGPLALIAISGNGAESSSAWIAFGLIALSVASLVGIDRLRLPEWADVLPALGYIGAVGLLHYSLGAAEWVFSTLLIVPLFWLSLFGTRRQLLGSLVFSVCLLLLTCFLAGEQPLSMPDFIMILVWPLVFLRVQDLVARVRAQGAELERLSLTDSLTGAGNRRSLDAHLAREFARAGRVGEELSVVLFDLDHFKRVNDEKGHEAGDQLLMDCVAAWSKGLRASDSLARYGGEEFALVLPECGLEHAIVIADRCREMTPLEQTCSAGVATWDGEEDPTLLLARADIALYKAKARGRNQTVSHAGERRSVASVSRMLQAN